MKSRHRLTLERYEKYGEGYNPSINYEDKVFKIRWLWQKANNPTHRAYGKIRSALYCACVLVGLSCVSVGLPPGLVCACVSQSVCLVCTCVSVGLPCVYMCVSRSALCVHVCQ